MRLTALYIEDQNSEERGYTVNLGGFNYYKVRVGDGVCTITAKKNDVFINNFFDDNAIVTNVSAIVGNNGSGKTTLIHQLLKLLNENFVSGITIWEDEKGVGYINRYKLGVRIIYEGCTLKDTSKEFGTIYYSPYLDHKTGATGIDISADRYLREDLVNIDSTFDATNKVIISERLKRADYKRYIKFQKSKFAKRIIEKYGLLNDDMYRVVFIRHSISISERNAPKFNETPRDFREFLIKLYKDIVREYKSLNRSISGNYERFELQKNMFKNLILMDLYCLLVRLMENHNMYLEEGHFNDNVEASKVINSNDSAENKLKYWLNNYYYSKGDNQPLPNEEVISILNFLYDYLDSLSFSSEDLLFMNWNQKSLFFDEETLFKLLDLNEGLLSALPKYYLATQNGEQNIYDSLSELQHFVSLEFANRKLSSGETAMLNLYSRLFDFFSRNVIEIQTIKKEDYYIMFLDEADLGYHPEWKRSFVNTVLEFSKDFFNELGSQIQIVFTTHDALSLSDIPNTNVVYMHSLSPNRILDNDDPLRPQTTFAANVNDLLGHSFFLKDLLIGDFANSKIEYVIKWINDHRNKKAEFNRDEFNDVKKTISLIEEIVLRNKLTEMLNEVDFDEQFIKKMIQKQSDFLSDVLNRSEQ